MKKLVSVCALLLFIQTSAPNEVNAYKFNFVTVSDVVKKVKQKFADIENYSADFTITSNKNGSVTQQAGSIKYKATNKMLVEFTRPHGQRIVSNGKMLWIYIPHMNVVAEQDLKADSGSIFSTGSRSGLRRLFSKYHYRFASKEQPEPMPDGSRCYTLFLKQKESRSGFRTMRLWINEEYMINKAYGETSSGKKVEIVFSNVRTNANLPNGIFRFAMPQKARVIKNPMMSEE